jgi:hypothetical protein
VRATDANSATMAASIRKVLLAVVEDGSGRPRDALFPADRGERARLLAAARALRAKLEASPEFVAWQKAEQDKRLAALGAFLSALDQMTGLPTSQIYRTVLNVWRGDHDYLDYLKTVASLVPHGGALARTIVEALEYTAKARKVGGTVVATVKAAGAGSVDAMVAEAKAQAGAQLNAQTRGVVLNTASRFALERADRQLSFFKDSAEVSKVTDLLAQTNLMRS